MGGGGERVLWTAIKALQASHPNLQIVIYIRSMQTSRASVLSKVEQQFGLGVDPVNITFVHVETWRLLDPTMYPRLTLILQSLGSIVTAFEALYLHKPAIFLDTVGHAFTYPVAKLYGSKVITYTHYPTISTDMINRIWSPSLESSMKQSFLFSLIKFLYYKMFTMLYGWVGRFADRVLVNSSWTDSHIQSLWKCDTRIIFPPCDTEKLTRIPLTKRENIVISLAQFRPEKNHLLQLHAVIPLIAQFPDLLFFMVGSCRNAQDRARITALEQVVQSFGVEKNVSFVVNASQERVQELLSIASIGLHTMMDEHFGIGIIEYMASGVIPVAHNSAGPKMDIIVDYYGRKVGYLAATQQEYTKEIRKVLEMKEDRVNEIRMSARAAVKERFSSEMFSAGIVNCVNELL